MNGEEQAKLRGEHEDRENREASSYTGAIAFAFRSELVSDCRVRGVARVRADRS